MNWTQTHLPTTSATLNTSGKAVCNLLNTVGVGKVRFCARTAESIGRRLSGLATGAEAAGVVLLLVWLLLDCADLLLSPEVFFCDVVFMVFFFLLCCASSVRRPSRKAEAPALPRGSALQKAPRGAGWSVADAVRATERDAEAEKAGPENEAPTQKTQPSIIEAKRANQLRPEGADHSPQSPPAQIQKSQRRGGVGVQDAVFLVVAHKGTLCVPLFRADEAHE